MIVNVGVIFGGLMVYFLESHLPDLLIGFAIVLVVIRGGITIIKDASKQKEEVIRNL